MSITHPQPIQRKEWQAKSINCMSRRCHVLLLACSGWIRDVNVNRVMCKYRPTIVSDVLSTPILMLSSWPAYVIKAGSKGQDSVLDWFKVVLHKLWSEPKVAITAIIRSIRCGMGQLVSVSQTFTCFLMVSAINVPRTPFLMVRHASAEEDISSNN